MTNTRRMTGDELVVEILLGPGSQAQKEAALRKAAKALKEAFHGGECPSCGHQGPHEDNGASRRSELAFLCTKCGEQWDSEEP